MLFTERLQEWIVYWVFEADKNQKTRLAIKILLSISLIVWVIDINKLQLFRLWKSGLHLWALFIFLIIIYFDDIVVYVVDWFRSIQFMVEQEQLSKDPTIDWIKVEDLCSFLFEYEGLPVNDFKKYFNFTNEQITRLGENLDRVNITRKDPEKWNRRMLINQNPNYIIKMLLSNTDSDKIGDYSPTGVDYYTQDERKPLVVA